MTYKALAQHELDFLLSTTSPHSFKFNIEAMNRMYRLPINTEPTLDRLTKPNGKPETARARIENFLNVLRAECDKGDKDFDGKESILSKLSKLELAPLTNEEFVDGIEIEEYKRQVVTDLADWLGDIVVYCRSEAMKLGIPLEEVLEAIQGSNASKLPYDGTPIYDKNGKFIKDMTRYIPAKSAVYTVLYGIRDSGYFQT